MKKFVFVVLMLLVGAGWAGFHAPELLPQAQRLADDALSHFERDDGAIHVEGSGAALPDVKKAASAFDGLTQEKLGAVRHHSVRVFVATSDADYRRILKEEFSLSDEEAQEVAAISGGWSGGRLHVTAVNAKAGVMDSHSDRYATTAHELFHQLQYELSRGRDTDKEALFWLEEGSADYVGAMMAEHLGGRKLARWQNDVLDNLLGAPHAARPDQLIHLEFAERKAIMAKEYHAYEMADMMTVQLLARFPEEQRGQRLAAYFTALGEGKSGEEAFAQTFGLTLDDFLQEFAAWWQAQKSEPAKIQIEACEGVADGQVDSYAAEAEAVQSLLQRRFGQTLRGSYTLVLASGKEELAQAVRSSAEECRREPLARERQHGLPRCGSTRLAPPADLQYGRHDHARHGGTGHGRHRAGSRLACARHGLSHRHAAPQRGRARQLRGLPLQLAQCAPGEGTLPRWRRLDRAEIV